MPQRFSNIKFRNLWVHFYATIFSKNPILLILFHNFFQLIAKVSFIYLARKDGHIIYQLQKNLVCSDFQMSIFLNFSVKMSTSVTCKFEVQVQVQVRILAKFWFLGLSRSNTVWQSTIQPKNLKSYEWRLNNNSRRGHKTWFVEMFECEPAWFYAL